MSSDRYTRLCERIRAHCRERNWYGPDTPLLGEADEYYEDVESYPNLFNPVPFDLEKYEKREGDRGPFLLSKGAWPLSFLQLCGAWYGDAYCLHAPSDHVYAVWAEVRLWRVADSLEEWLERWLEGGTKALYERFGRSAAPGYDVSNEEGDDEWDALQWRGKF